MRWESPVWKFVKGGDESGRNARAAASASACRSCEPVRVSQWPSTAPRSARASNVAPAAISMSSAWAATQTIFSGPRGRLRCRIEGEFCGATLNGPLMDDRSGNIKRICWYRQSPHRRATADSRPDDGSHNAHGRLPLRCISSSAARSLRVSIGAQKPSNRTARNFPARAARRNASVTRSSPGFR